MCLFKKKPPIPVIIAPAKRRIITHGRNLYGGQDLKGCWNDSVNLSAKAVSMFSDFDVRKFRDYDATGDRYLAEASGGIQVLSPGATVLVMADSCFSETLTRGSAQMNIKHPTKNRFHDPGLPPRRIIHKMVYRNISNHILMSGCQEHETSSDAYINGEWAGAFTFFALMSLHLGMTYREWYAEIRKFLPSADFTQTPTIEGPDYLLNRKVFEDETLIIHNSSHGSYVYDKNGDEEDGQDETIYLDRHVVDYEIGAVLQQIPK